MGCRGSSLLPTVSGKLNTIVTWCDEWHILLNEIFFFKTSIKYLSGQCTQTVNPSDFIKKFTFVSFKWFGRSKYQKEVGISGDGVAYRLRRLTTLSFEPFCETKEENRVQGESLPVL